MIEIITLTFWIHFISTEMLYLQSILKLQTLFAIIWIQIEPPTVFSGLFGYADFYRNVILSLLNTLKIMCLLDLLLSPFRAREI